MEAWAMWRAGLERLGRLGLVPGNAPPLGVDFGTGSLKVLQLGPGSPACVMAAVELPTPDAVVGDSTKRFEWQLEQLPMLLKDAGIRARRAVFAIPSAQTFCKSLRLQVPSGASLEQVVQSSVAGQLQVDPAALCCRTIVVRPADVPGANGEAEVIALATSMGVIGRLMDAASACRLRLAGIYPETIAIVRAFDHITRRAEDADLTSLYLDLGSGATKLAIAHGKDLVFAKAISLGGRALDALVARQGRYTLQEAHEARLRLKRLVRGPSSPQSVPAPTTGVPAIDAAMAAERRAALARSAADPELRAQAVEERRVSATPGGCLSIQDAEEDEAQSRIDLSEPLAALTEEIMLCLRYYEQVFPGRQIGRAVFVGGESRQLLLCQHIARTLRLPASVGDPLARFGRPDRVENRPLGQARRVDLDQPQPGWAVATGLAVSVPEC
jgi:Tfp pilus assembly PilM family ATPase